MTEQNKHSGKTKCQELRRRGGVPYTYKKWAVYLIPGYKDFWDATWQRVLLVEEERRKDYEQFARELRDKVEMLEEGNNREQEAPQTTKKHNDIHIIAHKKTKSKSGEE